MKKFGISVLLTAAILGLGLNSCDKDSFTEEDAMNLQAQLDKQRKLDNDSLETRDNRVSYTINLVDASTSTLKSGSAVSAVSGAMVKFVQDTTILIQPADASGIVTFSNLKPGNANINVSLSGYAEVNYTVDLSTSAPGGGQFSNIIPLIPVTGTSTGTIKGKIVFESDLTNKTPEIVPEGTKVLAMVKNLTNTLPSLNNSNIVSFSYDNLSLSAITDVNGEFTMTVPATTAGLQYDIIVSDFSANQRLLKYIHNSNDTVNVFTTPTYFGTSFDNNSSAVPSVNPIIITIGAPDYTFTPAAATAVIDNVQGIDYVQNTSVGNYYYNSTNFSMEIVNPSTETGKANATIQFRASNGHMNVYNVSGEGAKFPAAFEGREITIPYILEPAKAVVDNVNGSGAITAYHVVNVKSGKFFSTMNIQFTKHTGGGTGTITDFPNIITVAGSNLTFSSNPKLLGSGIGSGFQTGDSLILTVNSTMNDVYKGKLHMTTGTVTAINITGEGANYIPGNVDILIDSPLNGTKAQANATVTLGMISSIQITDGGNGYTAVPKVTIVNKMEKKQARYKVSGITNGQIDGFTAIDQGLGYLTEPTVTISTAVPGIGSGAKAKAVLQNNRVSSLTIIDKGNDYQPGGNIAQKDYSGPASVTVKGNISTIINIDLGTGKRTVE